MKTPYQKRVEDLNVTFQLTRLGGLEGSLKDGECVAYAAPGAGRRLSDLAQEAELEAVAYLGRKRLRRQQATQRQCRVRWLSPQAFKQRFPEQVCPSSTDPHERWHLFVRVALWDGFCPWGADRDRKVDQPDIKCGGFLRVSVWEGWNGADVAVRAWDYDDGYWIQTVPSRYAARELVNRMIALAPLHVKALYALGFQRD